MPTPSWDLLAALEPLNDQWTYTAPTDREWFRIDQTISMLYPNSAIGFIADAEFLPDGKVSRTKSDVIYHTPDSTLLYRPRPLIISEGNRRIAIRRYTRSPSFTPWNFQIYQSDIMGLYNQPITTTSEQAATDSTPSTFAAPTYLAATPAANYQALIANPLRRTFAIANTGTQPVRVDFDAPTSATSYFIQIAAGSTYEHDKPYTGTVFIWSTVAAAQNCNIREFV
jgi:hypothetical protein